VVMGALAEPCNKSGSIERPESGAALPV